ncbi:MAG: CoA transferase, partial [Acetobacteraceae bacterium]|nr:CoA transferase [Acetobacteraceae bacterium]
MPHASSALARFTVLDLSRVRAGPTCTRQLADWGADVIEIEMPAALASSDPMGGPRDGPDFQNLHRNKRSMTLDLKQPEGLAILKRLVERADVLVENFRPDVKDRLGIGYEALAAVNPRLVYASISGFGQDGPYAERPGFDQIAQGMGGLMSITGLPGQGPVRVGIPVADLCAGLLAAQGVLVALSEREVSGCGQWVQTSLLQAQVFMLDFQAARWLMAGEVPQQAGNNHPTSIPTGVFRTRDGHVNIAAIGQRIWERFAQALDAPQWLDDPRFATGAARSENRDALTEEIEARTARETSAALVARLNDAGVPSGPINSIDQVFADAQVRHLGIARTLDDGEHRATYVGQPVT